MTKVIIVYVTCPNIATARKISRAVVKDGKAACTNILPQMESHYRWQGKLHQDKEVVLLIKTAEKHYKVIEEKIRALHPYENPCVLALKAAKGRREYLDWIKSETGG